MATPSPTAPGPTAEVEPEYRYERKFVAENRSLRELELAVKTHSGHFRVAFPPRTVNNIYLDSPELRSFATHVHGASDRQKLRIRWYGESHGLVGRPTLEMKIKRGQVGTKLRQRLEPFAFDGSFDFEAVRRSALAGATHGALAAALGGVSPALYNRYHRQYYCTVDGSMRLTVDTELHFAVVNGRLWGPRAQCEAPSLAILELKYDVEAERRAADLANRLRFRMTKFSKYVYGLEQLGALHD